VRPFQARQVKRELLVRRNPARLFLNKFHEPRTEIPQREGLRRIIREIGVGEAFEFFVAENRAQAGIILVKTIAGCEPVLPVVNFQSLEGSQPVVRLDELSATTFVGLPSIHLTCIVVRARSGRMTARGHEALQRVKFARCLAARF
jgi:hypothetical protein